jgi:ABC-type uncharacterized transport system substrate-binding protein
VAPGTKVIGVLENPNGAPSRAERGSVLASAHALGQQLVVVRASQERDFDGAFATLVREHAGALLVTGDGLFTSRRDRLVALATRHTIPTIHGEKVYVRAGALMSYGTDIGDGYRLAGIYVGRTSRGRSPGTCRSSRPPSSSSAST